METDNVLFVLCLVVAMVVIINGALALTVLRPGLREQIRLLRKAVRRARNPWQAEDEALAELRGRVSQLTDEGVSEAPEGEA